ncbi:MAG: RNA methyltransferase [Hyphomonadaceae bacterium]
MTKGPPRNRPGNGGKSGGFRGRGRSGGGDRPRSRGPGGDDAGGGDDKPWAKRSPPGGSGERAAEHRQSDGARRFEGKPGQRFDKPRGDFRGKPKGGFERGEHRGPRRDGGRPQHHGQQDRREAAFEENGEVWIWGIHAATAALNNPMRKISTALMTRNAAERAGLDLNALPRFAHIMEPSEIDLKLPPGAVHQGLAVRCRPFDGTDITEAAVRPDKPLVILDQVTDPQNVGAIFRSAAAFGVAGVVMQTRNAPALGGALAKAATGAIEKVDEIRAVNLSRAIDVLVDAGWKVIGLDGTAEQTLDEAFAGDEPLAIVMGAEGAGLRQGVAKACSGLARIPIGAEMESLNVSNAAAIAFYEAARRGGRAVPAPKSASLPASDDDADDDGFDDEAE